MKKYLFMALAAFAFVSCSNDFDGNGVATNTKGTPISFDVYAGDASRGTIINNLDSLKKTGFSVFTDTLDASTSTKKLFFEANVEWASTDWVASPAQFWVPGKNVDFYFYAPKAVLYDLPSPNDATSAEFNKTAATFMYHQPAAVANQKDILWGAPQTDLPPTPSAINVVFSHVMSHITFKAKSGPNNNTGVSIASIKLKGDFYIRGKMNFGAGTAAAFWTDTVRQDTVYQPMLKSITLPKSGVDFENVVLADNDLFIIPTEVKHPSIEVTYNCQDKLWKKTIPMSQQNFAIGQSYTIQLTLDADLIKFDVTNDNFPGWGTSGAVPVSTSN